MYIKIKNFLLANKYTICLMLSVFLYTFEANAETFDSLKLAGNKIFEGLNRLIKPASMIGIACVCIAGMFGKFNWKWLVAIVLGIFIVSMAGPGGLLQSGIESGTFGEGSGLDGGY